MSLANQSMKLLLVKYTDLRATRGGRETNASLTNSNDASVHSPCGGVASQIEASGLVLRLADGCVYQPSGCSALHPRVVIARRIARSSENYNF